MANFDFGAIALLIEPLIRKVLEMEVVSVENLTTKLQYTLEREADFLQKITVANGGTFALHIEFQSANDPLMSERMLQYCGLIYRAHRLPVLQYVFYIGKHKLNMSEVLQMPHFDYRYKLVDLRLFPYQTFLASDNSDEVVLAILCNFELEDGRVVISKILRKLKELNTSELKLQKNIRQLEVLAKIKDLQKLVLQEEQHMALTYDIETDIRFKQGKKAGIEKGIEKTAISLLKEGVEIAIISKATGLSTEALLKLQKAALSGK